MVGRLGIRFHCVWLFCDIFLTKANQTEQAYQAAPTQLAKIQMVPDTISVNGDLLSFRGKEAGQTYQVFYILKSEKEQEFFKNLNQTMLLSGQVDLEEATPQRNFGGFDYRTYLKHEGIYRIANLSSITEIRQQSSLSFLNDYMNLEDRRLSVFKGIFLLPCNIT